ncbi:MAG: FAD-binding oxidoreductase [Burkholderiales bacterium]
MSSPAHLIEQLSAIAGPGGVLTAPSDIEPYLADWRKRLRGNALCVVMPRDTAQVSAIVAACSAANVPMVPQGGNTGLCGGATPDASGHSVVINLKRMNRVRAIDTDNNTMTVEAGCILQELQRVAEEAGRLFPLSLAAEGSCQIGGNLSTNAGGVHVLRYGNTRELTLGLEVVLAGGQVWDGLRGLRKDNTGYDLKQLFIGGEGTLGIITAAVLKLFPLPKVHAVAWLGVASPEDAVAILSAAQDAFGTRLTAFEFISDLPLSFVLSHIPGSQRPMQEPFAWHVLMELSDSEEAVHERLTGFLAAQVEAGRMGDGVVAQSAQQAKRLWSLREHVPEALTREGYSIKHDISVPVSRIPEFLRRGRERLESAVPGLRLTPFGHLGDGNLHYNISRPLNATDEAFAAQTGRINALVHDLVHELGGSISAEHGLGTVKREEARRYKSAVEMEMMQAIKRTLDPRNLMNPGKVV